MLSMVRSKSSNGVVRRIKVAALAKGPYVSDSVVTLHDPNNMNICPPRWFWSPGHGVLLGYCIVVGKLWLTVLLQTALTAMN
jgi:hypothetical protein